MNVASVSLEDVVITQELLVRPLRRVNRPGEIAALHSLATILKRGSTIVLKRLASLAVELCGAGTAGVSVLEAGDDATQVFRWQALAGELEHHEGGTTPRDWSPCGECLNAGRPMLYAYPAKYFSYFQEIQTPIVEGLVIPMYVDGLAVGTIWIVSHDEQCRFDAEDVRIMTSLGNFAAAALRFAFIGEVPHARVRDDNPDGLEREIVWAEFVRCIAQGDESALAALSEETQPLVFSTALRILSFRADAEEVTSDVYARVWRSAPRYDRQRGDVAAWLVTIAHNCAIDMLRSSAGRHRFEEALCSDYRSSVDYETAVTAFEAKGHIRQALQALPFEQRRTIELVYFSGFTMAEIAERLGQPIGSVKSRVRMGLSKLRLLLAAVA